MIEEFSQVVWFNNVKAAIKLQFRIWILYIQIMLLINQINILENNCKKIDKSEYRILIDKIRDVGCIPMSTPFDEKSVDLCVEFDYNY